MVQEANIKRAQAEKALAESEMKVETCQTKIILSLIRCVARIDVLYCINIVLHKIVGKQIFTSCQIWSNI